MGETFSRFDAADYLKTPEDIRAYLEASAESGDPSAMAAALGAVARAQNMAQLAREAGITREGLYKALKPGGNPAFATIAKIARALGYEMTFRPTRTEVDQAPAAVGKRAQKARPAKTKVVAASRPMQG